jgi:hypothetical protein
VKKSGKIGGVYSMREGEEKFVKYFHPKMGKGETSWEIQTQMGMYYKNESYRNRVGWSGVHSFGPA